MEFVNEVKEVLSCVAGMWRKAKLVLVTYLLVAAVAIAKRTVEYLMMYPSEVISSLVSLIWHLLLGILDILSRPIEWAGGRLYGLLVVPYLPAPEPEPEELQWYDSWYIWLLIRWEILKVYVTWYSVGTSISFVFAVWMLKLIICKMCKRRIQKFRGIYVGEAVKAGSTFFKGQIPDGQIAIMLPGLLMDTHIGFGLRVDNVLVAPLHVFGNLVEVVLVYKEKKLLISLQHRIESRAVPDLAYLPLHDEAWTKLGAPKVKCYAKPVMVAPTVMCVGPSGQCSTGMLTKHKTTGMLIYSGSTKPGMSGAGYFSKANSYVCHGIHTGVMGDNNVGISMALICHEIVKCILGESSSDFVEQTMHQDKWMTDLKKNIVWTEKLLKERVNDVWTQGDDQEDLTEFFADYKKRSFNECAKPIPKTRVNLDNVEYVRVAQQGNNGKEVTYQTVTVPVGFEELSRRIDQLEAVIAALQPIKCKDCSGIFLNNTYEQHQRTHNKFACDKCDIVCQTQEKLDRHTLSHSRVECDRCHVKCKSAVKLANHRKECKLEVAVQATQDDVPSTSSDTQIQNESAFAMDSRKYVKTTPFLGVRKDSQRKTLRRSSVSSATKGKKPHSPSQEEILSQILQSQKSMQENSEKLLQAIAGLSLARQQN